MMKNVMLIFFIKKSNEKKKEKRIDPRSFVKSRSESNYLFNDTKIFVFWRQIFLL